MAIISAFVREQKRYTKSEIEQLFILTSDETDIFIKNLKAFGVLKSVKNSTEQKELSDLVEEDIEITDVMNSDENLFVFTYVGVITVGTRIIKCYPKYLLTADEPLAELKKVLKVLKRYESKKQIVNLYNGDGENNSFNMLAVILFLLNDYHEYGVYNNSEDIIEINGGGEILWDKTINESFTLISNNRPYYIELFTKKTVDDEYDFIKQLHECILTECSNILKYSGLLDLFDLPEVTITDITLDSLGDVDYIMYKLQTELNIQFETRKQILLKTLYMYIVHNRADRNNYGISMYGTNSFNLVWEEVCSKVFDNKLNSELGQLELPILLKECYKADDKLIDIIEKPIWSGVDSGSMFQKCSKDTLTPDIITIANNVNNVQFIILDAKYYNIQLEKDKRLVGTPGVGDVTKQYLYQLAYMKFITDHNIETVKNCFVMPTQYNVIINKGTVRIDMLGNLGLQDIQIRLLPAELMYEYYLRHKILDISALDIS